MWRVRAKEAGSVNPYARPPACPTCSDVRRVTTHVRAHEGALTPCGKCGNLTDDEYERFRRDAWVRDQKPQEICELDLTPEEFTVFGRLRQEHPKTSKTTILSWIEGQRFDPSKDEAFLVEARKEFKK